MRESLFIIYTIYIYRLYVNIGVSVIGVSLTAVYRGIGRSVFVLFGGLFGVWTHASSWGEGEPWVVWGGLRLR